MKSNRKKKKIAFQKISSKEEFLEFMRSPIHIKETRLSLIDLKVVTMSAVDPADAPDYYTVIHNPMDFSTMKKKLEVSF